MRDEDPSRVTRSNPSTPGAARREPQPTPIGRTPVPGPGVTPTPGPGRVERVPLEPIPLEPIVGRIPISPRPAEFVGNLFKGNRPGQVLVRPEDLLAVRIELRNLEVTPGEEPRLVKRSGAGAAHLILHFPPQAVTEQTFFETRPAGTQNPESSPATANPNPNTKPKPDPPGGSETPGPPPVRARIAGESRVSFVVPDGFDVPYTVEGVLEACRSLALSVASNARPPVVSTPSRFVGNLFDRRVVARLSPAARAALSSFAARSLRIAAIQGDAATLAVRQFTPGSATRATPARELARIPDLSIRVRPPRPQAPSGTQTAIEMPWRLIVSPHSGERWHHATTPVTSPTGHTELWHSRLVAPDDEGQVIQPPQPDPQRTIRAIWALTGEASSREMTSHWPNPADLPEPSPWPFRMPLDDFDRFQFAHLSSNFSVSDYAPEAISTNLMMLSSLGGWLDSRGAWDPPGLSVEEWVHRASMARDHYVRVVYRGFLFPFGHRVSLVKVSERKFHSGARGDNGKPTIEQLAGNPAYLRQRLFIVVRERERRFDEPSYAQLRDKANTKFFSRQFPFSKVRILTQVTPNLDQPGVGPSAIAPFNSQRMFWPHVDGRPFRFQCVATDLDGRQVAFDLGMIFMDNTLACPRSFDAGSGKLKADYATAEGHALRARTAYAAGGDKRVAQLKGQRVALATSLKAGDTSVQVESMSFAGEAEAQNQTLRNASDDLSRPVFFPAVSEARASIGPLVHLSGSGGTNRLLWNAHYLKHGFGSNKGEVFADVASESGMAMLDFSAQGDRSGGFVQPNLRPEALSRFAGPVMGDVGAFIDGVVPAGGGFPTSISDLPMPLLFGCIPLGELIRAVGNLTDTPERIPKFASEASTRLESFVNEMGRLYGFITQLAAQPGGIAAAGIAVFEATLDDLIQQSQAYAAAQVAPLQTAASQLVSDLAGVATQVQALVDETIEGAPALPALAALPGSIAAARTRASQLVTAANAEVDGVSLPSGLRQSALSSAQKLDAFLADLETLPELVTSGKALWDALDEIVGQPEQLGALFSDPGALKTRIEAVAAAMGPVRAGVGALKLLDGAPRKTVLDAMGAVEQVLGGAGDLLQLVEMLTGDELTIRFDWNPEIDSWWLPGANKASDDPIFRANNKRGFLVAVEAKVKKNGSSAPNIGVTCSLKHFDLVLIAPANFLELNFEKIEFSVDSGSKVDVDVLLSDIKFVGPLSFVETLRDLIPLDGFSDPPFLDVSPKGIDAGFSVGLPGITIGVMSLTNVSLGAGFTVPFIGQPLSVRFMFCSREQPFLLTVYMFGGGGFFAVTIDPNGVQILEAAFEFGASISVDFGVASGGVHVMAGIYYRMEANASSLSGYFRLGGHVDVLGLITASIELYLELNYQFESGKCVGKAQLKIQVKVFIFSGTVTIKCERKFAGSNGDPSLREMMGFQPLLPLEDELAAIDESTEYAWREYCEAFAA